MCGICGELRLDQQQPDISVVERMMKRLERRGPDYGDHYVNQSIAFGHRRLSVIDLSEKSNQPMRDEELTLVFNGAIYNYKELRVELINRGYQFKSDGDSEVILKAYREWGAACPEKLHGMFAFSIWDDKKKHLYAVRDRFGIKPFYYSHTDKHFRFASNLQAILAAGDVDKTIDHIALHFQYSLHGVIPAPRTILNGVRKLSPATWMIIDERGKVKTQVYWKLDATTLEQIKTEDEWAEAISEELFAAVRRRYDIADVPVGVLLSGGLDSSLLVGILAEIGVSDLRTFSVGFEDHPSEKGSEFEFSDQVAERYQTKHNKFIVPNSEVLKRLPEAVAMMSEPMFGQDAVAFYLLAEQVSKEIKVVQSGQGADEVFGGYFWYQQMHAADEGSRIKRFSEHYFDRSHDEMMQMLSPQFQGSDYTGDYINDQLNLNESEAFLNSVLRMDSTMLVVDDPVKRVDNMTMAFGLEARVPFLDHKLVEVAARCPASIQLADGGKNLLKKMARGRVPDSVIDRPKGYFPMPALKYVRGEFLSFMQDILNSKACRDRALIQRNYIDMLLSSPEKHLTRIQGSKLWHLALLEYWLQINVDPV